VPASFDSPSPALAVPHAFPVNSPPPPTATLFPYTTLFRSLAEQVDAQQRATEAQRELAELARTRYQAGVVSYLEVLDAERNLFDAEQALLQVRRAEAANLIALYVALGGGTASD